MPAGGRSSLRPGVRGKPRRGRVGPGRAHSLASPGIDARCSLRHSSSRTIMGIALTHAGGAGGGGREERCLKRERQGRGNSFPRPASRLPPRRYPHGPRHGEIPEKTRARLPTRHRPGHGCSPDIATHCPCPPLGAGEERRRRGRGGGAERRMGSLPAGGAGGVGAGEK